MHRPLREVYFALIISVLNGFSQSVSKQERNIPAKKLSIRYLPFRKTFPCFAIDLNDNWTNKM